MRTTRSGYISSYWPVALAAALIVLAALRAYGGGAAYEPLPAEQVTAELARTVSYGLIDAGSAAVAPAVHRAQAPAATPQAS
ncbi:MAG TPA: hypothetical protein VL635_21450 [Trinickia sp.]|jgi:hypothetical protein|nr:hypothetical protein [Trinickia sp.]